MKTITTTEELSRELDHMQASGEVTIQLIIKHGSFTWHKLMATNNPVNAVDEVCSEIKQTMVMVEKIINQELQVDE